MSFRNRYNLFAIFPMIFNSFGDISIQRFTSHLVDVCPYYYRNECIFCAYVNRNSAYLHSKSYKHIFMNNVVANYLYTNKRHLKNKYASW